MTNWLGAGRLAYHREHLPVLVTTAERMLAARPWLGGLWSVRSLWNAMFRYYARDLFDVELSTIDWTEPKRRVALIYLANTAHGHAIDQARERARDTVALTARRIPWLARSSIEALDLAVATVASHIRIARVARRLEERG